MLVYIIYKHIYNILLMFYFFTSILSLAHLFYSSFTDGPNTSASALYDNTRGARLTQEGCTLTERKAGRVEGSWDFFQYLSSVLILLLILVAVNAQKWTAGFINKQKQRMPIRRQATHL